MLPFKIVSMGSALPSRVLDNTEVGLLCGRSAEWIKTRTGVEQRRWLPAPWLHPEPNETTPKLGALAAEQALQRAGLDWSDIDLVINGSGTPYQALPDGSCHLMAEMQALCGSKLPINRGVSIHTTCLSFLSALEYAALMVQSEDLGHCLVVSSDCTSVALDPKHAESFSIFGDGAAAAVVRKSRPGESGSLVRKRFRNYISGIELTEIRGGGSRCYPTHTAPENNLFYMDGPKLLRLAKTELPVFFEGFHPNGFHQDNWDWIVPHQASKAGLAILDDLGWPQSKILTTLSQYGNVVAASIPLTLEAFWGKPLMAGQRILLVGTGAGIAIGAIELIL
jgi:3-oxoacyl-[acyl-carrier-protein] synthase III